VPLFIVLSKLTDEGSKTVKIKPDRIKEVNQELEEMGVKVLEQYVVLGEYDFVNVVEAPDNETVMKAMLELNSRGTVRTQTMPAIKVDDFIESLKK